MRRWNPKPMFEKYLNSLTKEDLSALIALAINILKDKK